jgi:hypothetical protein
MSQAPSQVGPAVCILRRFPNEIINKILIFATLGEPRMPAIIKALRGSKGNYDMYTWALYYYYSCNSMTITTDNIEALKDLVPAAAEPTQEIRITFEASVGRGSVSLWVTVLPDGPAHVTRRAPSIYKVAPFPTWGVMMKFTGLRKLHLDLAAYPAEKFHMVEHFIKNIRNSAQQLKRLSVVVELPLQLPLNFLEDNIANEQIPEPDRVRSVWSSIVETFMENLPPCEFAAIDALARLEDLRGDQAFVDHFMHIAVHGWEFGVHDIMDVVWVAERKFSLQGRLMSVFIGKINCLLETCGKTESVNTGQIQTFVWNISASKR